MLVWEQPASNGDEPGRRYNLYSARGSAGTDFGVGVLISRVCESVISRCAGRISRWTERIRTTWVCLDRRLGTRKQEGPKAAAAFRIEFLTVYPPQSSRLPARLDDLFVLHGLISNPENCQVYNSDRSVMLNRLLQKTAKSWVDSWSLFAEVEGRRRDESKWPVRLWVRSEPERVWEIGGDGSLRLAVDAAAVDETIMDLVPREPPPPPATDLELLSADASEVAMRWRPAAGADRYVVERSADGYLFLPVSVLSGRRARPGADGYCVFVDRLTPGQAAACYRVWAARGPAGNFSPEPTRSAKVPPST